MKKQIIAGMVICLSLTSCVTTYKTSVMKNNYDFIMDSPKNAKIAKDYPVYFSDSEVNKDFDVISFTEWQPFSFLWWHGVKRFKRYTLQKAVFTAKELNGDGVIIIDQQHWKVIKTK